MAYLFFNAKIIKASSGKSAVAAAAYQSASKLYDEKLGVTYQYRRKEEVVFSEILLPANAPAAYGERSVLWNAVEAKENQKNSQYARQFIIAMPKEWSQEQSISCAREFLQKHLVDAGMVVDWAFHMKEGNPHIHILCTTRAFKEDGTWAQKAKKVFVLDEHGERIPEIDPKTGEQKIRVRTRNGVTTTEKVWKRTAVRINDWNTRQFLHNLKKSWVAYCNEWLEGESQIDHRSFREGDTNIIPQLHEGPETRAALERGIVFDVIKENQERRQLNQTIARLEQLIRNARKLLDELRIKLLKWREVHDQKRSLRANSPASGNGAAIIGLPTAFTRNHNGAGESRSVQRIKENADTLNQRTEKVRKRRHRH